MAIFPFSYFSWFGGSANSTAGLVQGSDGNFYGTTSGGGAYGVCGAVFRVTHGGTLTTLYSFGAGKEGTTPLAGLVQGTDGNFYGTTEFGGAYGVGSVFRITPGGTLITLYSFTGGADGANPYAGLVQGFDRNFYGTSGSTVFRITPGGILTTLYSFKGKEIAGAGPYGGLVQGTDGNFYGTTEGGGAYGDFGAVFRITPGGKLTTLCSFSGTDGNGAKPYAGLVQGTDGNFYGTTESGGADNAGTVFKLIPNTITVPTGGDSGFAYQVVATNNPTSFGATGLPNGLGVNTSTGLISGTPTASGTFEATISAANASGTGSATLTFIALPPPTAIASALSVTGTTGFPFSYQIAGTNNPTSFSAIGLDGLPTGLSVNPSTGLISGTPTGIFSSGIFTVIISASNAGGTAYATLTLNILALPTPPIITSALITTGTTSSLFTYQMTANNNPTSFGLIGPDFLRVDASTGLISGIPGISGTFSWTISATNAGGMGYATLTAIILQGPPPPPLIISTLSVAASEGSAFSYQIDATNDPTSFGATSLPNGLTLSASSGMISGTPTETGTFGTIVSGSNAGGIGSATLTIGILAPLPPPPPSAPAITSALGATGTYGSAFSYQIAGSNNPTSFGATGDFGATGLPNGLTVNPSTGLISGTPTVDGLFFEYISATNTGGTGSALLILTIAPPPPVIASGSTAYGTSGYGFTYQIYLSLDSIDIEFPIVFAATGLPPGLSINASTGLISGIPTASGTFAATVSATDAGGTDSVPLLLTINVSLAGLNGSYVGLGAVGGTNVALFTITLTTEGAFSGKLTMAGARYPLKGAFSSYGRFNGAVNMGNAALGVALSIDPSPPSVSGTITVSTTHGTTRYTVESSPLGSFKDGSFPAGLPGRYTVIFPAVGGTDSAVPDASGYGTMTVTRTGALHIRGKLGDGTAFNTSAQLHADEETWTLFDSIYPGRNPGSIAGEITFESSPDSDCDGAVDWIKPPQTTGAYYRGGFSVGADLLAAIYTSPPLTSSTAALILGGENLPDSAITDSLAISSRNHVTVSGTDDGRVTLTLTPSTGAFSGSFLYPGMRKRTPFDGVIYQKPTPTGFGLFLGPDQSGNLQITQ